MNWVNRLFGHSRAVALEPLRSTMLEYLQAPDLITCRHILETHPEILGKEGNQVLEQIAATKRLMSMENARLFDERRELLVQCRKRGIEAVFAEFSKPDIVSGYTEPKSIQAPIFEIKEPQKSPPLTVPQAQDPKLLVGSMDEESEIELAEVLAQIRRENPQAVEELDHAIAVLMGDVLGPRCLTEALDVICPHCKYGYQADMWVIVDAQERPELAAQCHIGTIHDMNCPKCSQRFTPDIPLLYHDGEAQQLILATQENTTSEQDQEVNRRLFAHLFPRIPGGSSLDYLNTTRIIPSPQGLQMLLQGKDPQQMLRRMLGQLLEDAEEPNAAVDHLASLAEVLSGPPPDEDMVNTVQAFLEADTWTASKRVVDEHPELLSEQADRALAQMIVIGRMVDEASVRVLEEHRTLLQRSREVGTNAAFAEKMGVPFALTRLLDLSDEDTDSPEDMASSLTEQDDPADMLLQLLEQAAGNNPDTVPLLDKLRRTRTIKMALTAGSPTNFAQVLQEHPELRDPETIVVLDEIIHHAQSEGHTDMVKRMTGFRELLASSQLDAFASFAASLPSELVESLQEMAQAAGSAEEAMLMLSERGDIRRALARAVAAANNDGSPQSLIRHGNLLEQQGQWDEAAECYVQALTAYEQAGDVRGQSIALGNLGDVFKKRGQYDMALTLYKRSAQSAESIQDLESIADIWVAMAGVYTDRGEYDKADELFSRSRSIIEASDDKRKLAGLYNNHAILHERRREYIRAESYYKEALAIYQQLGDEEETGDIYGNLGGLYAKQKQDRRAMEMFEKCLSIQQQAGQEYNVALTYGNIAVIFERQEDYPKALDLYGKSLEIAHRLGADSILASVYGNMGGLYAKRNDHNQAITYFQRSIDIAEGMGAKDNVANGYFNLGQVYREQDDNIQAVRCFKRAKDLFVQLGAKEDEVKVSLLLLIMGAHS